MVTDDKELVRQALAGSEDAYRELVVRYQKPLFSLVFRMVRDRAAAEDLTQEAFVKAFGGLSTYDPRRKFSSWLFKIAHNATIDQLRRSQPATVPLERDEEDAAGPIDVLPDVRSPSPLLAAQRTDLAECLERAIDGLRPAYREAVLLRHQEGLAYDEIAEVTGLPLGTVKTFLHRARKELAATLTAMGWGPEEGET